MQLNIRWCFSLVCVLVGVLFKVVVFVVISIKGLLDVVICWFGEGIEEIVVVEDWFRGWLIKDVVVVCQFVFVWEVVFNGLSVVGAVVCFFFNWAIRLCRLVKSSLYFCSFDMIRYRKE